MKILGTSVYLIAFLVVACSSTIAPLNESHLTCVDCPLIRVIRIIDGHTFDSDKGRVRLFGVDTPERGQRCYQAATDRLRELAGDAVRVQLGPRSYDQYGRLLYYVYTSAGESIDEALITEGLGKAWTRDGQHRDYLYDREIIAKVEGLDCLW